MENVTRSYIVDIAMELKEAKIKHPYFPETLCQQFTILQEEVGEVAKAINDYNDGEGTKQQVRQELLQSTAMCLRMLENLKFE